MIRRLIPWFALATADPVLPPDIAPAAPPTVIPLRPAIVPRPALRYQLVPERAGLLPGNAASFYLRALLIRGQPDEADATAARLIKLPPADLPREQARQLLDGQAAVLREVELGTRHRDCDWGLDDRPEGVGLLLPEIQHMRILGRLVLLQARLAIADGRLDDALASIRRGLTLARHVGDGPTLIQGIVGNALALELARCVELLIAAPGAPSLFWALADRPRPLVDLRRGYEGERHIIERDLPVFRTIEQRAWTTDEVAAGLDQVQAKLVELDPVATSTGPGGPKPAGPSAAERRAALIALCEQAAPAARRALIAAGRPAAEVEAFPAVQVALLHVAHSMRDRRDEAFKWVNIRSQAMPASTEPSPLTDDEKRANPLLAKFAIFEEGLDGARRVGLRVERRFDALQVVEAIRLDATRQGGRPPAGLDAILGLPIPPDPATGRPFGYRIEDGSAVISAPSFGPDPAEPGAAIEIRLSPPPR